MKMEKIREIFRLSEKGISKREIARATNVSRPVVSEYLDILKRNRVTYDQIQDLMQIQEITCHQFRLFPASDSGNKLPPIPVETLPLKW